MIEFERRSQSKFNSFEKNLWYEQENWRKYSPCFSPPPTRVLPHLEICLLFSSILSIRNHPPQLRLPNLHKSLKVNSNLFVVQCKWRSIAQVYKLRHPFQRMNKMHEKRKIGNWTDSTLQMEYFWLPPHIRNLDSCKIPAEQLWGLKISRLNSICSQFSKVFHLTRPTGTIFTDFRKVATNQRQVLDVFTCKKRRCF